MVADRHFKSNRPSILSMSLGGDCETSDCALDSLVMAVEFLVSSGIIVSVAAGNDGCNACVGSPNAAPNAFNVAASQDNDKIAYFSNYGECIDVVAPGYEIVSSCTKSVCGNEYSYVPMSGTSMAVM